MTYEKALAFIYSLQDWERGKERKFDLSLFQKFLKTIGSPGRKVRHPILIAGTKGKSSTARILSSILRLSGKTGLFTSPHLTDIRERIEINGTLIPRKDFVRIVTDLKPFITRECSTFEALTAIAFVHFTEQATDYSIFEVGLGGRLDATNTVTPDISVLTPISLDHTEILGKDLLSIAAEKCEIIREHGKVVSAPQTPEVMHLIENVCSSRHAKLWTVGKDLFCEHASCSSRETTFSIGANTYALPILGRHQIINALTAMCVASLYDIPDSLVKQGLAEASSPGRLQIISRNPWVVFDGAHNVASATALKRSLVEIFKFRRLFLVFGIMRDKDSHGVIEALKTITDFAFVSPVNSERSSDPQKLLDIFKQFHIQTEIVKDAATGLEQAKKLAQPRDLILATGSLYLVGELLASLK
jgi:dihydrofolate synthase/folylpolyglutamate synthase